MIKLFILIFFYFKGFFGILSHLFSVNIYFTELKSKLKNSNLNNTYKYLGQKQIADIFSNKVILNSDFKNLISLERRFDLAVIALNCLNSNSNSNSTILLDWQSLSIIKVKFDKQKGFKIKCKNYLFYFLFFYFKDAFLNIVNINRKSRLKSLVRSTYKKVNIGRWSLEQALRTPKIKFHDFNYSSELKSLLELKIHVELTKSRIYLDFLDFVLLNSKYFVLGGHQVYQSGAIHESLTMKGSLVMTLYKGFYNPINIPYLKLGDWQSNNSFIYYGLITLEINEYAQTIKNRVINGESYFKEIQIKSEQILFNRTRSIESLSYMKSLDNASNGLKILSDKFSLPVITDYQLSELNKLKNRTWIICFQSFSDGSCEKGIDKFITEYNFYKSIIKFLAKNRSNDFFLFKLHPITLSTQSNNSKTTSSFDANLQIELIKSFSDENIKYSIAPPTSSVSSIKKFFNDSNLPIVVTRHGNIGLEALYAGLHVLTGEVAPYASIIPKFSIFSEDYSNIDLEKLLVETSNVSMDDLSRFSALVQFFKNKTKTRRPMIESDKEFLPLLGICNSVNATSSDFIRLINFLFQDIEDDMY